MSMINSTKYGYKKTINFMLGVFVGFSILMIISSYSNLFLLNYIPKIKPYMKIIGGLYMLYLSIIILKPSNKEKTNISKTNTFKTGLFMQLVNFKVILYCLTVMSSFIIPVFKSKLVLLFFSFFLAFIAFISLNCWAIFGNIFKKLLIKYDKIFNLIMSLLLLYSALMVSGLI